MQSKIENPNMSNVISLYAGCRMPGASIETLITRHTERRADFTDGLDTPVQTTAQ